MMKAWTRFFYYELGSRYKKLRIVLLHLLTDTWCKCCCLDLGKASCGL
jgi:hypothetical protein